MVIVFEDLTSSPPALRNGQGASFSLKLQSVDQDHETVTVTFDLPISSPAVFQENGSKTISKVATVFSAPTDVPRSYAVQNAPPGAILAVVATVQQVPPRTSSGAITILV
jgi:hypothetical protein